MEPTSANVASYEEFRNRAAAREVRNKASRDEYLHSVRERAWDALAFYWGWSSEAERPDSYVTRDYLTQFLGAVLLIADEKALDWRDILWSAEVEYRYLNGWDGEPPPGEGSLRYLLSTDDPEFVAHQRRAEEWLASQEQDEEGGAS